MLQLNTTMDYYSNLLGYKLPIIYEPIRLSYTYIKLSLCIKTLLLKM